MQNGFRQGKTISLTYFSNSDSYMILLPQTFNVGTGLSDKLRKNPPKIGAIVTYRFQELTKDGVPRFPSYIGEAIDKDEPKDAEVPEHKKGTGKADEDA